MEQIAEKIKDLRKKNKLSQEQFAKRVGISRSNISKWESGQIVPSIEMLQVIANSFEKDISYFVQKENNNKRVKIDNISNSGVSIKTLERSNTKKIGNRSFIDRKIEANKNTVRKISGKKKFFLATMAISFLLILIPIIIIAIQINGGHSSYSTIMVASIIITIGIFLFIFSIFKYFRW